MVMGFQQLRDRWKPCTFSALSQGYLGFSPKKHSQGKQSQNSVVFLQQVNSPKDCKKL